MASTYYINADSGNDSTGDGSSGSPWLTLSKAHTSASSGDTVVAQASSASYTWTAQTFSKTLTLTGESSDVSNQIFDQGATAANTSWDLGSNGYTVTVENIRFYNSAGTVACFYVPSGSGATGTVIFNNCEFKDILLPSGTRTNLFASTSNWTNKIFTLTLNRCLFDDIRGQSGVTTACIFEAYSGPLSEMNLNNCTFVFRENGTEKLDTIFDTGQGTLNMDYTIFDNQRGSSLTWGTDAFATESLTDTHIYGITGYPTLGSGSTALDPQLVDTINGNYEISPESHLMELYG